MKIRGVIATSVVVLLSTIALSYIVLRAFSGLTYIRVGSTKWYFEGKGSLNQTQLIWASLLGMSSLGFSVGSVVAANNPSLGLLLGSYSGDWIFRTIFTLIVIGIAGGVAAEDRSGAAVASAIGMISALVFGAILTFQVLPPMMAGLGMSPGNQSDLISAIAVSMLAGALPAALITAVTSAIISRAIMRARIIRIEPLRLPPLPPEEPRPYRFCPNCGANLGEFSPDRSTCPKCGEPLPINTQSS